MYTESEIRAVVEQNRKYKLKGWETVQKYTVEGLKKIYNGAGPEAWPDWIRVVLTKAMGKFKGVILVHDVQFSESNGTREMFDYVTQCWIDNCRTIFDAEYPLYTLKIFNAKYRREREYWWTVMKSANVAIASDAAFDAWKAAWQKAVKA